MQIIEKAIKDLIPYEKNPRHNDEAVKELSNSIKEFGFKQPLVIDRDNIIVCGHTRWKAAKKLKLKTVPCVIADDLTPEQIKAYRLADNKTAELASWDFDLLGEEIKNILDIDMSKFGFNIDDMLENEDVISQDEEFISEKETPIETMVKEGEIYILGAHRLMCGDVTKFEDINKLMDGNKVDMVFTDPPYNVGIGTKNKRLNETTYNNKGGRIETDIENDIGLTDEQMKEQVWRPAFSNMNKIANNICSIYVTMPQGGSHMMLMLSIAEASWQVKHELIWEKSQATFSLNRLDYDYKHEPIMYGWNKSHKFYGKGEQQLSVWNYDKPSVSKLHPTMKPVPLIINAILNSSLENNIIFDGFGGSGSTLIACEETKRQCFMMEKDPKYVDVMIQRWEKYTGKKAQRI